ncbi:nuclear transport factor 2 family protein (plasmid) [Pseudomonas yamanorum]|nr:nuclear transport factor 2 family protein [Pseudomonas yamanorum]
MYYAKITFTAAFLLSASLLSISANAADHCQIDKKTVHKVFKAIDGARTDLDRYQEVISDDSMFVFGNYPASKGKEEIKKDQGDFFKTIKGMSHKVDHVWIDGCKVAAEGRVTYISAKDKNITVPFVDTFIFDNNKKVKAINIYIDVAPLYQD